MRNFLPQPEALIPWVRQQDPDFKVSESKIFPLYFQQTDVTTRIALNQIILFRTRPPAP